MLALSLMGCTALEYMQAITASTVVTFACIAMFFGLNRLISVDEWVQLCFGGTLAVLGIFAGALLQRRAFRNRARGAARLPR
jgi:uncharacterized membrane protein YhhN